MVKHAAARKAQVTTQSDGTSGLIFSVAAHSPLRLHHAGHPIFARDRQADLTFANGAVHRIYFALQGKDEMRVRAFSGIPGAPLQKFEFVLTRSKRDSL